MQLSKILAFGVAFLGFAMAAPVAEPAAEPAPVAEPEAEPEAVAEPGWYWHKKGHGWQKPYYHKKHWKE
ncbi:hypothetical protein TWF281_008837 [Arthrobotrys megalospora]